MYMPFVASLEVDVVDVGVDVVVDVVEVDVSDHRRARVGEEGTPRAHERRDQHALIIVSS